MIAALTPASEVAMLAANKREHDLHVDAKPHGARWRCQPAPPIKRLVTMFRLSPCPGWTESSVLSGSVQQE
jgi:hypothetical protein